MHRRAPLLASIPLLAACGAHAEPPPVVAIAPPPSGAPAASAPEPAAPPHDVGAMPITDDGRPLSPLELAGRAVFVREGCHGCHEGAPVGEPPLVARARGLASAAPSLATVGGKYPAFWHAVHLEDPRAVSPGSTMPAFPALASRRIDATAAAAEVAALRVLGAPYSEADAAGATASLHRQAAALTADLERQSGRPWRESELVALIAFLDRPARATPAPTPPTPRLDRAALERAIAPGSAAIAEGEAVFAATCAACHGADARGLVGPSLVDDTWLHGSSAAEVYATVAGGVPTKGMPAWLPALGEEKVRAVTAFVTQRLAGRAKTTPKAGAKAP